MQRSAGTYVAVAGLLLFGTITSLLAKIGGLYMFLTCCGPAFCVLSTPGMQYSTISSFGHQCFQGEPHLQVGNLIGLNAC